MSLGLYHKICTSIKYAAIYENISISFFHYILSRIWSNGKGRKAKGKEGGKKKGLEGTAKQRDREETPDVPVLKIIFNTGIELGYHHSKLIYVGCLQRWQKCKINKSIIMRVFGCQNGHDPEMTAQGLCPFLTMVITHCHLNSLLCYQIMISPHQMVRRLFSKLSLTTTITRVTCSIYDSQCLPRTTEPESL